jgi:hypothetical protein
MRTPASESSADRTKSVHGDGATGARIDTDAALGAVVRTIELRDLFKVIATLRALVDTDAARGAEVGIDNRD